jgi:hypothetical protein
MDNASAFSSNKKELEMPPIQPAQNLEKVEFKIPEVGQAASAKPPTPADVHDSANLAGNNLRNDYKAPDVAPKGDINYAATTLGNTMKETVTGLFGALKSKEPDMQGAQPDVDPQQQVAAAPVARPPAFGL